MDENRYDYSNAGEQYPQDVRQEPSYASYEYYGTAGQQDENVREWLQQPPQAPPPPKKHVARRLLAIALSVVAGLAIIWVMAYTVLRAASGGEGVTSQGTTQTVQGLPTGSGEAGSGATSGTDTGVTDGAQQGSTKIDLNISGETQTIVTDVTQVVEAVMPSIVMIDNNTTERARTIYGVYEEDVVMSGSGVIIGKSDTELLIVTNNHVVSGANSLDVFFHGDAVAPAQIRGSNAAMDLAVIAVRMSDLDENTRNTIRVATLGDSDTLRLGEPTIAIGNALGIGQSVTTGVVSALNREVTMEDGTSGVFIQTDAAINHGNSGGALINSRGEVIGINTAKLGGTSVEGMGFAIPITQARETIERLMNLGVRERVAEGTRGYLNVSVMTPQGISGAYVSAVHAGGGADLAGMQVGDIITRLDDIEVTSRDDLINALNYYKVGDTVEVAVSRRTIGGYVEMKLAITLQEQMNG